MKTPTPARVAVAVAAIVACLCLCFLAASPLEGCTWLTIAALGGFLLKDAELTETWDLPADDTATASGGFDLELLTSKGAFLANCELLINAPALTVAQLADTDQLFYAVYHADESDFDDEELLADDVIVQTGAGGAGAAAKEARYRLPTNVKRYVRVKSTHSEADTDASAASATAALVF